MLNSIIKLNGSTLSKYMPDKRSIACLPHSLLITIEKKILKSQNQSIVANQILQDVGESRNIVRRSSEQ